MTEKSQTDDSMVPQRKSQFLEICENANPTRITDPFSHIHFSIQSRLIFSLKRHIVRELFFFSLIWQFIYSRRIIKNADRV